MGEPESGNGGRSERIGLGPVGEGRGGRIVGGGEEEVNEGEEEEIAEEV